MDERDVKSEVFVIIESRIVFNSKMFIYGIKDCLNR